MPQPKLPRIVFDTNALVSAAILPHSISRQAFVSAPRSFRLVHSPATWWELYEVIRRRKFDRYFSVGSREQFLVALARVSEFLDISTVIADCPDPADNKFLELAVGSGASLIVSGDGHLLAPLSWH